MSIDHTSRVDALRPTAGAGAATATTAAADSAPFRRMLESLEQLAKEHRQATPPADVGDLQQALDRADEGFSLAMDLRRQLEEAFRRHQP